MNSTAPISNCRWCGMIHGPMCPTIKVIEFYDDGVTVKRVEFKTAGDYVDVKSLHINSNQATT